MEGDSMDLSPGPKEDLSVCLHVLPEDARVLGIAGIADELATLEFQLENTTS